MSEKWFDVRITMSIRAATSSEAADIALAACEHLQDTFNDDGSIGSLVAIDILPSTTVGES
jgi:hypothetical protein